MRKIFERNVIKMNSHLIEIITIIISNCQNSVKVEILVLTGFQ